MAGKQYIDLILKNLPLPMLLLVREKGGIAIVSANRSYLQITDKKEEEITGKSFFDLFQDAGDAGILQGMKSLIEDVIATGKSSKMKLRSEASQISDSKYKNAEITPIFDEEQKIEFLICSLNGISLSDKDLDLLMDNTEESFIQVDKELRILNYNFKFKENFREYFNKAVHKGDSILDYALPGHKEMLKGVYEQVFQGETVEYEVEIDLKDESLVKRIRYKPVYEQDKSVHSVFITSRDITNEKRSLAANEFERRDKEALINSTQNLIWSVSKSLKLVAANEAFIKTLKKMTGKEIGQGDDVLLTQYISEELREYWAGLYQRAFTGEHFTVETSRVENDVPTWSETSFNPIYKEAEVVGIACFSKNITEDKNAQQQLIQTNKRLKAAQKLASLGYWEVNIKSDKLYWSDEVYTIWEVDPDTFEVNAENLRATVYPDDLPEFISQRKMARAKNQGFSFEHRIVLPGGGIKWVHETGNVVFSDGVMSGFEGTVQDITENKLAEEALHESNERYKYATRATFDAIWDWDLITDNIYWGEGFELIFGHKIAQLQPDKSSWTDHIHPDDRERVVSGIYDVINGSKDSWSDEYWYLKADGNYAYVHDKGIVIRNEKEEAVRMIGAMHDLTQQKEEEKRLRLLESVITHSNDAIMITEADPINLPGPKVVFVNEAFIEMTGYSRTEIIGQSPRILQGPKTDRKELDKLKKALEKWKPCQIEVVNYKKSGEEFWIHISVIPITDSTGWYTHLIAIQRDVTDRRNYVEMLEKQNKALKEIAWTQSHVVRAPLARLMGLVNVIEMDSENEENRRELMGHISNSAFELDKIIRSIINKASEIDPPDNL